MHPADPYDAGAGGAGALVPFNPAGPAADQSAEERLVQFPAYGIVLRLRQDPQASGSQRVGPGGSSRGCSGLTDEADEGGGVQWPQDEAPAGGSGRATPDLSNVGLVVWQSGVVLAELLLRCPPLGPWGPGLHVMDLGTGTGLVGLALALAGARVTLLDLPHITPLARHNAAANYPTNPATAAYAPRVLDYRWGEPAVAVLQQAGGRPDIITAGDVLYEPANHAALLSGLAQLAAPHTLVLIAYRRRNAAEEGFAALAEAAGWAVVALPDEALAPEYRGGTYCVLRLTPRDQDTCVMEVEEGAAGAGAGMGMHEGEDEDEGVEDVEHKPCVQS